MKFRIKFFLSTFSGRQESFVTDSLEKRQLEKQKKSGLKNVREEIWHL